MLAVFMVMMLVFVIMAAAGAVFAMFVMVMMSLFHILMAHQRLALLDNLQQHFGAQVIPGGGDDAHALVVFFHQMAGGLHLIRIHQLSAAENHGIRRFDLVQIEFAKVLHVHFALLGIHHGGAAGNHQIFMAFPGFFNGSSDFAEFAHTGGFDQKTVGMIGFDQFVNGLLQIAHQRAANAAVAQFGHRDAGVLHKRAVYAHVAVFIFQQHHFFAGYGRQQLLDQRGFTRTQKTRNNIAFDHVFYSFYMKR